MRFLFFYALRAVRADVFNQAVGEPRGPAGVPRRYSRIFEARWATAVSQLVICTKIGTNFVIIAHHQGIQISRAGTRPRESGRAERLLRALSCCLQKEKRDRKRKTKRRQDLFDTFRVSYGKLEVMPKYILYCRKSTDEKDKQVLSIEAQIAELKEFAVREKLEIVATFTESRTAKVPGRPIFQEVLKKIEGGEADAILSWHPDRLARNSVDGGYLIYLLDCGKLLDLKFPSFWFDNTPQGKFMLNLAFGQSKYS